MQAWINPGVRCVCISDEDWAIIRCGNDELPIRVPMLGEILTIRAVVPGDTRSVTGTGDPEEVYLTFWEIDAIQRSGELAGHISWISTAFRPLEERETDITALTSILNDAQAPAEAVTA